jgi:hypothetical protein
MFLFELMMQKEFLGLKHFCWIGVNRFQVPGRVSSIFWLYLPFSLFPLLVGGVFNGEEDGEKISAIWIFLGVVTGIISETLLLLMVPFLSPPVLMYGVYRNIKSVWEADHQDWYLNPVGTQTSSFYAVVAMALEAVSEALPELVLQTRVFLASDPPLLSPFLYYQSMSLSLVSIINAAIVFYLSFGMLKYTISRLGELTFGGEIEKKLTNLVHFLDSKNTEKKPTSLDLSAIHLGSSPTLLKALAKTLKVSCATHIIRILTHTEPKTTFLKLPWPAHCFPCVSSPFSTPPLTVSFRSTSDRKTPPSKSSTLSGTKSAMAEPRPSQICSR